MTPILFYDTETSDLPLFSQPSEDPGQPHIVQLAALLVDADTRRTISSMDLIVRPEGWSISAATTAIHGITNEHAQEVGVSESLVLELFMELWEQGVPALRCGHNESFDARIIRIALMRFQRENTGLAELWKASPSACTGQLSRKVCALPKNKMPTLSEAYAFFKKGEVLQDAHSAMADTLACRDVYFAIKDHGK